MSLGERLSEALAEKELKIFEAAKLLGWSPARLSNYIRGKREPSITDLKALASLFKISVSSLIEDPNEKHVRLSEFEERILRALRELSLEEQDRHYCRILSDYFEKKDREKAAEGVSGAQSSATGKSTQK